MEIQIRDAQKEDAEQIQKLYHYVWIETYANDSLNITKQALKKRFDSLLSQESVDWLHNFIDQNIPQNHKYLVAVRDGIIVGAMYLEKETDHNRLQGIYILPKYQNQGLGKRFWDIAITFFDKNNPIILDVAEYNQQAIDFYTKLGFIDTGKRFLEEVSNNTEVRRPMMEMILGKK